jgi:lysophospholipase L1-like esterase
LHPTRKAQNYNGTSLTSATIGYSGNFQNNSVISATAWSPSSTAVAANGGTVASNANGMSSVATFYLGSWNGSGMLNGIISNLGLYNTTLSTSSLQALTQGTSGYSPVGIAAWGDSLTSGNQDGTGITYPNWLSSLYSPIRTVYNEGVGGNTSSQILARAEALPVLFGNTAVIWSGRNDYSTPTQVESDIAAMVAELTTSHYLVLGILNNDTSTEQSGGTGYGQITSLNSALSGIYGSHFINVRANLVDAYNAANPVDVLNHTDDVPPYTLRAASGTGVIDGAISSTTCSIALSGPANVDYTLKIDSEYIYITSSNGENVTGCIRGYGGSTATSHADQAAFTSTDPLHLGAAGYELVAGYVYNAIHADGW